MRLANKTTIVTGGSRGIGYAICEAFVKEGAKVALCGSRLETAEKAVAQLRTQYPNADILPLGVNLSDGKSIVQMVQDAVNHFGKIDVLVNNAGVVTTQSIFDMSDDDFDSVLSINLSAPFKCIREVAKVMKQNGNGGSIINTSSMVGIYGGRMQTAYASSKFGINGLTKSCAKELGAYNIRVNAVAPGVVSTDMVKNSVNDQMLTTLKRMTPLGRPADPKELAGVYVYLASDESSFTTGTIVQVDGGLVM